MIRLMLFLAKYRGLVATGPPATTVMPLKGERRCLPKFIAPSAKADDVGIAKAIAIAMVVGFTGAFFSLDRRKHGNSIRSFN
jgi:hypothetical protein